MVRCVSTVFLIIVCQSYCPTVIGALYRPRPSSLFLSFSGDVEHAQEDMNWQSVQSLKGPLNTWV